MNDLTINTENLQKYEGMGRDELVILIELAEQDFKQTIDELIDTQKKLSDTEDQNKFLKSMLSHIYQNESPTYTEDFGHSIKHYIKHLDEVEKLGILPITK
jgi:hypothetical protein